MKRKSVWIGAVRFASAAERECYNGVRVSIHNTRADFFRDLAELFGILPYIVTDEGIETETIAMLGKVNAEWSVERRTI